MKALTLTASIVLGLLVLAVVWLALFPGSDTGGPVVTVAVKPPPPQTAPARPIQRGPGQIELPPGFGLAVPRPPRGPQPGTGAPPAQLQSAPPSPAAVPQMALAEPQIQQTAAVLAPTVAGPDPPETESGSVALVSAPVDELVEQSQYGPLPRVAPDGRRPLDVYARPSRYAAATGLGGPPRVAVLVNHLGLSEDATTTEAIKNLPAPISMAYGAYGRNLQDLVARARDAGHEVLLQVPLEPLDYPTNDPGPHTLLTTLPAEENMKRLQWLMSRFTGYVGVTNLMGAKFQATPDAIQPVLEQMKARGLLFVEDGSVEGSRTGEIATVLGLDYASANVRIDAVQSPDDIAKALKRLEELAQEQGTAIGVVGAKPETIKQLGAWAEKLEGKGIVLVPLSAAVRSQRPS